jgi:hypothetical protein
MHVYCPLCEYAPTPEDLWECDCGHVWDTFTTKAACAACHKQHIVTRCPSCEETPRHDAWYHPEAPTPFLHCCENCVKPVARDTFPQPRKSRATVVRYLTIDKYRRLLREKALYLARLDRFKDPFEGSLPRRALARIAKGQRATFLEREEDRRLWAKQFYVSCWHLATTESDAMWRLYCGKGGGVCIVSTYARLAKLKSGGRLNLGLVQYIDYRTQTLKWWDSYSPMMHKRKAYEHEKEVRLVSNAGECNFLLSSRQQAIAHLKNQPKGYRLACDLTALIVRVLVSPYTTRSGFEKIANFTRTAAPSLSDVVQWSRMRESPVF